jgi:non-specific serine/threonine protein kinase
LRSGPVERKQLERRLAAARAEVGPEAAAEAWAEGHALSLDRLVIDAPVAVDSGETQALLKASGLTAREAEVVPLVSRGLSNREISAQLGFTERTAEAHVSNILQKLELASRTQLAAWLLARQTRAAS